MQGKTALITDMAEVLNMQGAKGAVLPEATYDKPQEGDEGRT